MAFTGLDASVRLICMILDPGQPECCLLYTSYSNSGDDSITEITCHAKGAHYLNPNVRTVIDIGGQDIKAISIDAVSYTHLDVYKRQK